MLGCLKLIAGENGLEIRIENEAICNPEMRKLARSFPNILDVTFTKDNALKQILFKEGEKHFCGELFRFYSAILEWEQVYKSDPKRAKLLALKLVATFVEGGSRYEIGCLSSRTREELLNRKSTGKVDAHYFDAAKQETAKDIITNPSLRAIVEQTALSTAGLGL